MATSSRSAKINKIQKVLKKAGYQPVAPDPQRSAIEHLLFAACLENAKYDDAEQAFAALAHNFFDWNEVRVTTIRELAEEISCLPDPTRAAQRIKEILQSVFETKYAFDLEDLRKENLGPATERLQKIKGVSSFAVAYVVQAALGGHAIPVDTAAITVMEILDLATPKDAEAGSVPGLERSVAKNKGIEFASLLHQFAVDFAATPHKPELRKSLLEIDPEAAPRLPKRRSRAAPEASGQMAPSPEAPAETPEPAVKAEEKPKKAGAKKTAPPKPKTQTRPAKDAAEGKKTPAKGKSPDGSTKPAKSAPAAKRSATKGLSKKKPR